MHTDSHSNNSVLAKEDTNYIIYINVNVQPNVQYNKLTIAKSVAEIAY